MGKALMKPAVDRIPLSNGEWIEVKRRLNAGESRRVFARMIKTMSAGEKTELDPMEVGRSQAVEYLLDWSFEDLPIEGKSPQAKADALDAMDPDLFQEVVQAVSAHEKKMDEERAAAKKSQDGETESSPILSSVA